MEHAQASRLVSEFAETQPGQGAIEEIDAELERFERALSRLEQLLAPVISQYARAETRGSDPAPEPATALRGRTQRLRSQVLRLDEIMEGVDL